MYIVVTFAIFRIEENLAVDEEESMISLGCSKMFLFSVVLNFSQLFVPDDLLLFAEVIEGDIISLFQLEA